MLTAAVAKHPSLTARLLTQRRPTDHAALERLDILSVHLAHQIAPKSADLGPVFDFDEIYLTRDQIMRGLR